MSNLATVLARLESATGNKKLLDYVSDWANVCTPDQVALCDGSEEEWSRLAAELVQAGTLIPLSRPNSFLARSALSDVARVEARTFICCEEPEDAGPTNNWRYPGEMLPKVRGLMTGSMVGRTMYIIPFCMGPLGSCMSYAGVQITDSAYVVMSMKIMTTMGSSVLPELKVGKPFIPCVHSSGCPIHKHEHMHIDIEVPSWPCDRDGIKFITHFPDDGYDHMIVSYGSGYGGNALLGKKCFALRIASLLGKKEMWMAEHMLVAGVTAPGQQKKYIAAAFPSSCGKTNLAMTEVKFPGWKWECVGDDIMWARIREDRDGRLYAINPEQGIFGVAPGTGPKTLKNAVDAVAQNAIFTNVGLTPDGDVWWEGLSKEIPEGVIDWTGKKYVAGQSTGPVAHPNARFTAPIRQCPVYDPEHESVEGVPLSAIMFGGRRSKTIPLVFEALSWEHGVFMGATLRSDATAAAEAMTMRFDPMAMLPFCGYHMGDYFAHWLEMGAAFTDVNKQPRIFFVNWFRRDANNKFIWPGFSENVRVIKWILERCNKPREDTSDAVLTPIGYVPKASSLDLNGLDLQPEVVADLLSVNTEEWKQEAAAAFKYLDSTFGARLPAGLRSEAQGLIDRLDSC